MYVDSQAPKIPHTQRALDYFDIALLPVYQNRWRSIRLALLSKQKYVAVVNSFADCEHIVEDFYVSSCLFCVF